MRIGLCIDAFYPMVDGVIRVVDEYARRLSKNHEVFVICPKTNDKNHVDDFPYTVIRVVKIKVFTTDYDIALPSLDSKLQKILKTLALDIIHMHSPFTMGELALTYAKNYGIPCLATLHSQYKKDFYDRIKSKTITQFMLDDIMKRVDRCDEVFTMNEGSKALYQQYGLKKTPKIIPNATEMTYLMGHHHVESLKKKYHIKETDFSLLFVGRIDKIKNLELLFHALAHLKEVAGNIKLYCIGKGVHESYFKTLSKQLHIDHMVTFVGPVYDRSVLAAWYELADLLAFPSTYDTNGLVQYEAASQKTPGLLIEGTLAASEIISDINGYVVKEDPILYANKIQWIMSHKEKHREVSEKAYSEIYHHWDDVLKQVEHTYEEIIHGQKRT
jgi:1,2-diacylglycerol 3-alpha-glucosyltransferase